MAYERDITADDKVFYDTDRLLKFAVYAGDPTAAEISAGSAVPIDVSGWELAWTVRKRPNSSETLIEKTTGSPGGIQVTGTFNVSPFLNTQRIEVTLEDTDTYDPDADPPIDVRPGWYHHALKRTDDGAEAVLAWGRFRLLQAAAWE